MHEKIEPLRFAHKETLAGMTKEVEQLYAEFFGEPNRLSAGTELTVMHRKG